MDARELLLAESELLALLEVPSADFTLLPVDSDAASGTSGSGSEMPSLPVKRRRMATTTATKRKPTYYARKEEKEALEQQLRELQTQVRALAGERAEVQALARMRTLQGARDANRQLRGAVSEQQFAFATIQSAMAQQVHSQTKLPFYASIRLGTDGDERRAALLAVKDGILRDGLQYVAERTRFFEPGAVFAEASRFSTPRGDFCALLCDTTPLEGVTSVRAACDALQYFLFNMETSISELLGVLMLREDSGEKHEGTFQSRLVSDVGDGVQVELNFATFSQMFDPSAAFGGGREFGVVVVEAVDEDDAFPYVSATRVRLDVSAAMTVTLQTRSHTAVSETPAGALDEPVVVITRTCLLSLRRPDTPVAPSVMRAVRDGIERWGEAMIKKVREVAAHPHGNRSGGGGAPMLARQIAEFDVCELLDDADADSR